MAGREKSSQLVKLVKEQQDYILPEGIVRLTTGRRPVARQSGPVVSRGRTTSRPPSRAVSTAPSVAPSNRNSRAQSPSWGEQMEQDEQQEQAGGGWRIPKKAKKTQEYDP